MTVFGHLTATTQLENPEHNSKPNRFYFKVTFYGSWVLVAIEGFKPKALTAQLPLARIFGSNSITFFPNCIHY